MIRQTMISLTLIFISLVSFCVCRNDRFGGNPADIEDAPATEMNPVMIMLARMMSESGGGAGMATSLRDLQQRMKSDITHIQKIPKRNQFEQEKALLEERRRELEEKQQELERNLVDLPELSENTKYSYENMNKRPVIHFKVIEWCQMATCFKDGTAFVSVHNYCNNGIRDLQLACEKKFYSSSSYRYRRNAAAPALQHNLTLEELKKCPSAILGASWKDDCNTCVCLTAKVPACTRMICPPTHETAGRVATSQVVQSNQHPNLTIEELRKCSPGASWKEDCNTCVCLEGGGVACTRKGCPPVLKTAKRETTSQVVQSNQHPNLSIEELKKCPPAAIGLYWKDDCNTCSCQEGISIPACTKKGCPPKPDSETVVAEKQQPSFTLDELMTCPPEAVGITFMNKCNSCTCEKGMNIASCTKKGCQ